MLSHSTGLRLSGFLKDGSHAVFGSQTNSASKESVAVAASSIVKVTVTVYDTASSSGLSDVTVNSMPSNDNQSGKESGVSTVIEYLSLQ